MSTSPIVSLFQSTDLLGVGNYILYTATVYNDTDAKLEGATLTCDIPYNLALQRNSVCVTDNTYTKHTYPFTYEKGELTVNLPILMAEETMLVTFVCKKVCPDRCTDTYETRVVVNDSPSNVVIAGNKCACVTNVYCY